MHSVASKEKKMSNPISPITESHCKDVSSEKFDFDCMDANSNASNEPRNESKSSSIFIPITNEKATPPTLSVSYFAVYCLLLLFLLFLSIFTFFFFFLFK